MVTERVASRPSLRRRVAPSEIRTVPKATHRLHVRRVLSDPYRVETSSLRRRSGAASGCGFSDPHAVETSTLRQRIGVRHRRGFSDPHCNASLPRPPHRLVSGRVFSDSSAASRARRLARTVVRRGQAWPGRAHGWPRSNRVGRAEPLRSARPIRAP